MRIPDHVIEEISRRIDIVELIGNYVSLQQRGSRFMGLCPFHTEKTASFSVNRDIGAYYCFGCHKSGSAFTFLMEVEGLTFPEAARTLGERVGVEVDSSEDEEASRHRSAMLELYARVSKSFSYFLTEGEDASEARDMLRERGITEDSIEAFALGFAPNDPFWLHPFLTKKGYSAEFLQVSGLFTRANPRRALFAGRLMFPIAAQRGDVIAFGGRLLAGDGPKYINSPETVLFKKRNTLYGINVALRAIRSTKSVVLAEGYTDVIALNQAGIEHAVAPLGTALTSEQADFLLRYAESIHLVFDGDEAGMKATRRAAEVFERKGTQVVVTELEEGVDPAQLLADEGSQAVVDALSSPLTVLEYLLQRSLRGNSVASPEGKEFVLRELFPYITLIQSEVRRGESLRLVADYIGVPIEAVRLDFRNQNRDSKSGIPPRSEGTKGAPSTRSGPQVDHGLTYDLYLMLAVTVHRDQFAYVRRWVQPENLDDVVARELFVVLEESFRRGEETLDLLLAGISDPDIANMVRRRLASGEFEQNQEQGIRDAVMGIRQRSLDRRRHDVEVELRRMAAGKDSPTAGGGERELLEEKMHLDRELQKLRGEG